MRAKLLAIVAILWVAAVGAVTIAFYVNRPTKSDTSCIAAGTCYDKGIAHYRTFEWGGWLAWTGAVTLAATAAIAIIYVLTRQQD